MLGSFYQPELSRVQVTDDMIYRVDKVLRKRKNQVLVSWLGWPQNTRVGFQPTSSKTIRTLLTDINETMESYRRLFSSVFDDGIVNIGRIHVVLMLTVYVARKDPTRSKDLLVCLLRHIHARIG